MQLRESLEEAGHQGSGDPKGSLGLEVLDIGQERVINAGGGDGAPYQFRTRMLLRIAWWFQGTAGRERMHAVDHAGLLHRPPDRIVFGLQGIVTHRVDW